MTDVDISPGLAMEMYLRRSFSSRQDSMDYSGWIDLHHFFFPGYVGGPDQQGRELNDNT